MAPIYDVIEELATPFAAEKQRYTRQSRPSHEPRAAPRTGQKGQAQSACKLSRTACLPDGGAVDAQVSAKQKTERLIDARQAVDALRDDPDAMQQLAAYALQIAAERHV